MVDRLDQQARRQALSDLMDGAVGDGDVARACASWREDGQSRADWYAYHVIGDVLRSEDLAHRPQRDEAFLAALRTRLAAEPVVLAPQQAPQIELSEPLAAPRRVANGAPLASASGRRSFWRRAWAAPTAVAAGFMAVAGMVVVTGGGGLPGATSDGAVIASVAPGIQPVATTLSQSPAPMVVPVASGRLIRDARLDRYLAAHKQYGGSSVLAMPAVSVRGAAPAGSER